MAIEILDLPISSIVIFHSYVNVYQGVTILPTMFGRRGPTPRFTQDTPSHGTPIHIHWSWVFRKKISSRSISHSENFGNPHIQIETKTWNAGNYVGNIIMFTWKRVCRSFGLMRWAKQEIYPTGTGYCLSKKEGLEKDRNPVKGLSNTIYRCDV